MICGPASQPKQSYYQPVAAPCLADAWAPAAIPTHSALSCPSACIYREGKELVSVGEDKAARIWDTETGRQVRTLRGEIGPGTQGYLYAAGASGDLLAVGGYTAVRKTVEGVEFTTRTRTEFGFRLFNHRSGRIVRPRRAGIARSSPRSPFPRAAATSPRAASTTRCSCGMPAPASDGSRCGETRGRSPTWRSRRTRSGWPPPGTTATSPPVATCCPQVKYSRKPSISRRFGHC